MKKTKTKFNSSISDKSSLSYKDYLKAGLEILHSKLSVKTYKLAHKKEYPIFRRGEDLRIQIHWDKKPIYEFIVELPFWFQNNGNKDDRKHMRRWADIKLEAVKNALERGKKDALKRGKKK